MGKRHSDLETSSSFCVSRMVKRGAALIARPQTLAADQVEDEGRRWTACRGLAGERDEAVIPGEYFVLDAEAPHAAFAKHCLAGSP